MSQEEENQVPKITEENVEVTQIDVTPTDSSTVAVPIQYIPTTSNPLPDIPYTSDPTIPDLDLKIKQYIVEEDKDRIKIILENGFCLFVPFITIKSLMPKEDLMPDTEEERTTFLLKQIYKIRKDRNLTIESIDKALEQLRLDKAEARDKIITSPNPKEAAKWKMILGSFASDKTLIDSRRHLVRMSYMEEGKLKTELLELQKQKGVVQGDKTHE